MSGVRDGILLDFRASGHDKAETKQIHSRCWVVKAVKTSRNSTDCEEYQNECVACGC